MEKKSIAELNLGLRELNNTIVDNVTYPIKKLLGGDLKMLAILYGLNQTNSQFPCVWCEFDVVVDSLAYQLHYPISRLLSTQSQGRINPPIIGYIEFIECVPDTLHLFLRFSECLFRATVSIISILDNNFNNGECLYLNKFCNFLENLYCINDPFRKKR